MTNKRWLSTYAMRSVFYTQRGIAWGFVDQIVVSASNFVTMIILARSLSPGSFGQFVVWYTLLQLCSIIQSSSITQPHNILGTVRTGSAYQRFSGTVAGLQLGLIGLLGMVAIVVFPVLIAFDLVRPRFAFALLAALPAWQFQEFLRRMLYTEGRTFSAFANDLLSYGLQAAIVVIWTVLGSLTAVQALNVIAGTYACGAMYGCWQLRKSFSWHFDWLEVSQVWSVAKWLVAAAVGYWVSVQSYFYISALVAGSQAVAALKAAQILVGPLTMFLFSLDSVFLPRASSVYFSDGHFGLTRFVRSIYVVSVVPVAAYCLTLSVFSKSIVHLIYKGAYDGEWMIVPLYAAYYIVAHFVRIVSVGLRAQRNTKPLFLGMTLSAAVTIVFGWLFVWSGGANGAVLGMITGGIVASAILLHSFRMLQNEEVPPNAVAAGVHS